MKLTTSGAIETISGAHGNFVYNTSITGEVFASNRRRRRKVAGSNHQKTVKAFLQYAAGNWKTLTDAQRQDWLEYAKAYFTEDDSGRKVRPTGLAAYAKANFVRQLLGLPMTTDAPTLSPPPPLLDVEQLGAQNPDALGITVVHGIADVTNLAVLVRMTAAGKSQADAPNPGDYRFVRGVTPNSAQALPATGGQLIFQPTRFIINDGERYGVELRVARTTDGMVSEPIYGDFRKSV